MLDDFHYRTRVNQMINFEEEILEETEDKFNDIYKTLNAIVCK